ncbi:Protein kinase-like domain [Pseudocohnilembus persalinus]|uniref:non-specific serine/threonine protein kinase n=1 Tax=Pseudocohnilembus persalinus TaxID=266149 RepID=A0A0V0Q7H0_PSEPJ|nr:Protein kinase-like domain [Pseudocohnilembus persalinus]|eukprot:KRW98194.1 Protein kinase-like domain [Pseudocohnilembus persalinus]
MEKQIRETSFQDFNINSKLGEGAFSSVYKVVRKSDNNVYALKKVKMNKLTEKEKNNALNEIRILASINNENIIGYKEAFYDEYSQSLCIIQEFADGGDVISLISKQLKKKSFLPEELIWKWATQIIKGLKGLHDLNIMHRDIKSANIFLSKNQSQIKLGDLNVSKVIKKNQLAHTQTGTPYYAAPEIWRDFPYNNKCDIWSLGCVVYEICSLKPPFRAQNMEGLYRKIQKGWFERIPQKYSSDLQNFIEQCLQTKPNNRPNCEQLLNNFGFSKNLQQLQLNQNNQVDYQNPVNIHEQNNLIDTIKVPKNLKQLKQRLPKPSYNGGRTLKTRSNSLEGSILKQNQNCLNYRKPLINFNIKSQNNSKLQQQSGNVMPQIRSRAESLQGNNLKQSSLIKLKDCGGKKQQNINIKKQNTPQINQKKEFTSKNVQKKLYPLIPKPQLFSKQIHDTQNDDKLIFLR